MSATPDPNTSGDGSRPDPADCPLAPPSHPFTPAEQPSAITRTDWLAISDPQLNYGNSDAAVPRSPAEPRPAAGRSTGAPSLIPAGLSENQPFAHYRLVRRIGEGGMGTVYQAEDLRLRRAVALKIMKSGTPTDRERFLREARAMAALTSDHVVTIYDVGLDHEVPYFAMEMLRGTSLDQRLKAGPAFTPVEILRVGRDVALGLAAAHDHGLVHRDIKPGNVWLDAATGRAKILDFGLAKVKEGEARLTVVGLAVGTPAYAAPEQVRGKPVDARADLYSFGCVLYEMATGRLPFTAKTPMDMLAALATETPKPVRELNPEMPPELSDLVDRLLAKSPDDRPASAREVADRLLEIPVCAVPDRAEPGASPGGASAAEYTRLLGELAARNEEVRRRSVAFGAALAMLFCLSAGLLLYWLRSSLPGVPPATPPAAERATHRD